MYFVYVFFSQVKEAMKINSKLSESSISNEEFTQRLSTMEKKLQRAMAEKDALIQENQVITVVV